MASSNFKPTAKSKKDQSSEEPNAEEQAPSPIGEIEHGPSGMEAFLDANQKKLMVLGCLLIVAAISYVVITGVQKKNKEDAAAEISAATEISELNEIYEKYKDTPAGAVALNKIAEQQWADQLQEKAIETLKIAITDYPEHPMIGSLNDRIATHYQTLSKKDQAKKYFEAAVASDSAVTSHALIQLASIAKQEGDLDAASAYLERVVTDYGKRHPNFKAVATELQKLVNVVPATEIKPDAPTPKEASSAPVALDALDLPPLPDVPQKPANE